MKEKIEAGFCLPGVAKTVTQDVIDKYAVASGDFNPLHIDPEFAKKTQYKGTIAHGFLTLAYVSEMMGSFFGEGWLSGGEMDVKFLAPVRPGDRITIKGVVKEKIEKNGQTAVLCEVACVNQDGVKVASGTSSAILKD